MSSPVSGGTTTTTTSTNTTTTAYSTVKNGSKGDDVKTAQTYLNKLSYGPVVDGDSGSKTVAAIKEFQQMNGLTVDGICSTNTWAKLLVAKEKVGESLGNSVNIREKASKDSKSLGKVNKGNKFQILSTGPWVHVNVAGTIGYISSKYVG